VPTVDPVLASVEFRKHLPQALLYKVSQFSAILTNFREKVEYFL
jgi:hypothetical protein